MAGWEVAGAPCCCRGWDHWPRGRRKCDLMLPADAVGACWAFLAVSARHGGPKHSMTGPIRALSLPGAGPLSMPTTGGALQPYKTSALLVGSVFDEPAHARFTFTPCQMQCSAFMIQQIHSGKPAFLGNQTQRALTEMLNGACDISEAELLTCVTCFDVNSAAQEGAHRLKRTLDLLLHHKRSLQSC